MRRVRTSNARGRAIRVLRDGGVGIMATDTIYGVVGRAESERAVRRIYAIKGSERKTPFVILIGSMEDLTQFGVRLTLREREVVKRAWPGKVSVVLPATGRSYAYLRRGGKTLAFRLPAKRSFRAFLKKTGPLVAPSANPYRAKPAQTISEAKHYFGNQVDFYLGSGMRHGIPSALIAVRGSKIRVLREGERGLKIRSASL